MYLPVLKKDESYYIMIGLLQGEVNEVKEALTKYQVTGNPMEYLTYAGLSKNTSEGNIKKGENHDHRSTKISTTSGDTISKW